MIGLVSRQTEISLMPLFVEKWAIFLFLYRVATSALALSQEENITDVERVSPHLMQASDQS